MARKYNLKFNDDICNELCNLRESGLNLADCAKLCGIHSDTLRKWLKRGRESETGKYKEFAEQWESCNIKFKAHHLNKIAEDESWQSSAWILERTFPEEYAKPETRLKIDADVKADVKSDVKVNLLEKVKEKRRELNDIGSHKK